VERTIAQIWQEVLGLEEVGVQDNFFDLGGTSLQAVLVVSELEERLGVDLSSLSMFDRTTVRSLAGMLRAEDEEEWGEKISARRGRGERRRAKSLARLRGTKKADQR
jgi:acyl carrier protein